LDKYKNCERQWQQRKIGALFFLKKNKNQVKLIIFVTMILVTGGTGLVGAHLLLHLLENGANTVRAIYRDSKNTDKTKALFNLYEKEALFEKIEWVSADILDIPALEIAFQEVDYVYHCAALISFDPAEEDNLRKVNIEGTANIVNFCIDKKVKKLCHVSSIAALGDLLTSENKNQTPINEQTEWNPEVPHSDYAISKYGAEMEVWRGLQEGLPVVIVNPGVILGPGFWDQGSGILFQTVKKGISFYTNGSTGYVSVIDVVTIMHRLMNSDCNGEKYILISENYTYKDILVIIADKLDLKKPSIQASLGMLNLALLLDWIKSTLFQTKRKLSKTGVASLISQTVFSNDKIKKELNYSFTNVEDYITTIIPYYKN
jgi:nucleoside-diphosphate-sugar epimerase